MSSRTLACRNIYTFPIHVVQTVLMDASVSLFKKMTPTPTKENPWIFYDSNCGLPLFKGWLVRMELEMEML